jgi:hypothetical protein
MKFMSATCTVPIVGREAGDAVHPLKPKARHFYLSQTRHL